MAELSLPDESISILDDANSAGYQGNAQIRIPQFHIYSGEPSIVEEASHYALNVSCQSLQKRNRELEQQVQGLKIKYRSLLATNKETSLSPRTTRQDSASSNAMATNHDTAKAQEEFIQYLENELSREQESNGALASQLDDEKSSVQKLKIKIQATNQQLDESLSLLSSRGLELDKIRTENDAMKSMIDQLRKELNSNSTPSTGQLQQHNQELQCRITQMNAELSSMQQLYEEVATRSDQFEVKEATWLREKSDLEQTIAEKDKTMERLRVSNEQRILLEQPNAHRDEINQETVAPSASGTGNVVQTQGFSEWLPQPS
jgi:chromosome segregation ATPase